MAIQYIENLSGQTWGWYVLHSKREDVKYHLTLKPFGTYGNLILRSGSAHSIYIGARSIYRCEIKRGAIMLPES